MRKFLFSKKFNTEQIKTPYGELSKEDLLEKFKTENWSSLNDSQRLNVFQELENRYAVEQNRPVAKIKAEKDPRYGGAYYERTNVIKINVRDLSNNSSFEQLDSYYHESRHASQYNAIRTGKGMDETTRNLCKVEFDGTNYTNEGDEYDMQTCEMDSNNTASQKMLGHSDRYKSDPNYKNYLKSREEHFERVNNLCNSKKEYRFSRQEDLINRSVKRGTLSESEAAQIKSHIEKSDTEPVVEQSEVLEDRLRLQNLELESDGKTTEDSKQQFFRSGGYAKKLEGDSVKETSNKHSSFFEDNGKENAESADIGLQNKHSDFFEDTAESRNSANKGNSEGEAASSSQRLSNGNENAIV